MEEVQGHRRCFRQDGRIDAHIGKARYESQAVCPLLTGNEGRNGLGRSVEDIEEHTQHEGRVQEIILQLLDKMCFHRRRCISCETLQAR